jgi:hypothetical protein
VKPLLAAYQRNNPELPLRRFVRCGLCDRPLSGGWSKGKRARYSYYNCPVLLQLPRLSRRERVPRQQIEARFVELPDRLRPRPEILRLLSAAVLDRWNEEQREVVARRAAVEKRVEALRERKERVVNAYLYERAIDKETYQSHLAASRRS